MLQHLTICRNAVVNFLVVCMCASMVLHYHKKKPVRHSRLDLFEAIHAVKDW